jgi:hypothetical protein
MNERFEQLIERVWSIYLMMRPELHVHDPQKESVRRHLESEWRLGEEDEEKLLTRGLVFLMKQGLGEIG